MPLYEYECECGQKFEEIRQMRDRYNANCPMCKKAAHLQPSPSTLRVAETFRVVDGKGNLVQERQVVNNMPDWRYTLREDNLGEV